MALTRYKFGELIELANEKNSDGKFGKDDAIGVNIDKIIIPMRGDISEKDFSKFHLVPPRHFAYNPRGSRKLGIGFNNTEKTYIITFNDNVFRIKDSAKELVLDTYLFMFLSRKEWDRYAEFISWGSSTEVFDWNNFCEEEIDLPSLEVQQKYVDIYNSMLVNQQCYEQGLDDINLALNMFFDRIKKHNVKRIGDLIDVQTKKNVDCLVPFSQLRGINEHGEFTTTRDSIVESDIDKYLIVDNEEYAVNFMCLGNFGKFYLAYNDCKEKYLVSPACNVFKIVNKCINPYYFMYALRRSEFQRKCVFLGDGNTRGGININDFSNVTIPVPTIEEQLIITELYKNYENRRILNDRLKAQLKNICSILIKGSVEEAKKREVIHGKVARI